MASKKPETVKAFKKKGKVLQKGKLAPLPPTYAEGDWLKKHGYSDISLGQEIGITPIAENWVLITYDIPGTKEGKHLRNVFLARAKALGAIRHTDSVYVIPHNPKTMALANTLKDMGPVYVYGNCYQADPAVCQENSHKFEEALKVRVVSIKQRLIAASHHIDTGHLASATKMMKVTHRMLKELLKIYDAYPLKWVKEGYVELSVMFFDLYAPSESLAIDAMINKEGK